MTNAKFYIALKDYDEASIYTGYSWASGQWARTDDYTINGMMEIDVHDCGRVRTDNVYKTAVSATYYWLNESKQIMLTQPNMPCKFDVAVPEGAYYFAADFKFSKETSGWDDFYIHLCKPVSPHYKSLGKKCKRENNQMFFRDTIDGKVKLFGVDYERVKSISTSVMATFDVYKNDKLFITTEFNKTDCKFDFTKKSVELKLSSRDKYTDILAKYKNTYDLIKSNTAISSLKLTKRCVVQIYIQGEKVIANYAGGTYWETEVDEAIDSWDALRQKYYFYPGPTFTELNFKGFNYDINGAVKCDASSSCWNGTCRVEVYSKVYDKPFSVKFSKVYDANTKFGYVPQNIKVLSDGTSSGVGVVSGQGGGFAYTKYATYRIEIYTGNNGTGTKIYESSNLYGLDTGTFAISSNSGLYAMTKISQEIPLKEPTPATFNLSDFVVEYAVWARILCDVDVMSDGTVTYDLPYDDFAAERRNYKRCIGLSGISATSASVIRVLQREATSDEPTAYGCNDYGKYFVSPYVGSYLAIHGFYPLCRSAWANTSMWVYLDSYEVQGSFETWCAKSYKKYTLKDSYQISDVIKAILNKIDPTIKHEATAEYSEFLYGSSDCVSKSFLDGCKIYITQKTNILKGEYDQAAQKAEISLDEVMQMLRECFRCYWFIDNENRFRIEHAYYFTHGMSYSPSGQVGLDLTARKDKFNRRTALHGQGEIQYKKSDLKSRFEFSWMDDVTDAMGNIAINFKDKYIPQDNSEDINVSKFCPDIDYMIFMPEDFSNDGFAMLMAKDGVVEITSHIINDPKQFSAPLNLYTQNFSASWRRLINHRLYEAPGCDISLEEGEGPGYTVASVEKCMEYDVELYEADTVDINKMIKTSIGNGSISEVSTDIDTNLSKITLSYQPA